MKHWHYIGLAVFVGIAAPMTLAKTAPMQTPVNGRVPTLEVVLKPHQTADKVDYVDVHMTVANPAVAADATLVHMPLVVASIPTQRYDGDAIKASDASGNLPLTITEEPPTPFLSYRDWHVARATTGDVTLSYRAVPRVVDEHTRNGPLFDLREEAGGMDGAGFTFIAPPVVKTPYAINLHWDMSDMPAGSRGIWSFGEGDVSIVKPAEELATTFYYAGPVNSYPPDVSDRFHMYRLSDPPFDASGAAQMIDKLFNYVSAFFHDDGESYRVFIRKNPYVSGGGTALTRSFLFAYGTGKVETAEELEGLIAHEMVHNWPTLEGDHADTSWYTEGTAEYYSVLLSFRAGLSSSEEFLKRVNDRADGYYTNPLQRLSNHEAEKVYWQDARAGHVPYGRGFIYLASIDAAIRAKSHGKRSLDDIVLPFVARTQHGETVTVDDWKNAVAAELGPQARTAYDDMTAGKLLAPPPNTYAPCFRRVAVQEYPQELGFDVLAYMGKPRVIKNLLPGSAAERMGLQNGDVVIEGSDVSDPSFKYDKPVTLKISRNGEELTFTFKAEGQAVTGYHWRRNPHVSDAACKL